MLAILGKSEQKSRKNLFVLSQQERVCNRALPTGYIRLNVKKCKKNLSIFGWVAWCADVYLLQ